MIEYDCADCRTHVYGFGRDAVPEPPLCGVCDLLRTIPDAAAAEMARAAFRDDPETLASWKAARLAIEITAAARDA